MKKPINMSLLALVLGSSVLAAETNRIEIDAKQTGAVISPLLFGHNLEVTRRAIWRGLGAEMVANRKFAAVSNGLPKRWYPVPGAGGMTMDDKVVFVGKGAVRVGGDQPGGLGQQQEALAFRQGARYTFRWWLKSEAERRVVMRIADDKDTLTIVKVEKTLKPGDWQLWTGEFSAPVTAENARLEIGNKTAGVFWVGAASVQPADNFHGMRRDVIELLKQIKPGALRFPGGCYAEFYRWQDGLLPVDKRPPFKVTTVDILLPDTDDWDNQELGTDEFMALCREIGCDAALTMRLCGTQAEDAGSWVEYCNGGPQTKWGQMRAERGHREPYGVKTWFIGNEVYYFGYGGVQCAPQTKTFAEAMKKADPSVRLVGCTHTAEWNKPLFEQAGTLLSYTSIHEYDGGGLNVEGMSKAPTTSLWPKLQKAIAQRQTQPPIPAILDEWSTGWGKPGTVGTGLNTAGVLNLLCREAESLGIVQAYFFQPVNEGGIRVGPLTARLDTGGKVFAAFTCHPGNRRLKLPPVPADVDLDVAASISADGSHVYLTVINRSAREDRALELTLKNMAQPLGASARFLIAKDVTQPTYSSFPIPSGPSAPLVANDVTPQHTLFLEREERPAVDEAGRLELKMPRYSVAVLELSPLKTATNPTEAKR
ncbi:MAG: carbohydrate binding domain-containing protein [bacterium]